mgnify:CR=1 FL=1
MPNYDFFHLKLLSKISVKKTLESSAVTSLVLCHFVNSVVDSVKTEFLCFLSKCELTLASAALSLIAHFEVLLCGVCYNFAKEFCELCSVFSFFISCLFLVKTNFGVALSECCS